MLELLAYPVLLLVLVALFCREVIAPASRNACDHRWLILSLCVGASTLAMTLFVGWWFHRAIRHRALCPWAVDLPWPVVGLLSFLLTSFLFYWWHRATHHFDLLWRVFHQLHHSARRVESLTAFYAHPLDTAAAVSIGAMSSYVVLGASPLAAALALFLTGAFDLFLHADLRTPVWLGYGVQRPEMHAVHHKRGHHAQNYGLPLWDLLFGTWCNPRQREEDLGFAPERSARIGDMLMGRNVEG
ncbi:sterol desaturase family protein [Ideonella livida]|uniref:Sterol desaturase family protein n=1 Tax=Ideonella livida TaxID=2707176 RepID=A0A7C9PJR7_9BURK|nr:sterol desaturase family protein [Ideonella livida]NDY93648.1 sterol desaturase family protein [Ideonella livida]